jgi:hypothetical protein
MRMVAGNAIWSPEKKEAKGEMRNSRRRDSGGDKKA